ncbi:MULTISPECIES: DUF3389 family protein [Salinivibrio]|uniref:PTS sugar transporter subunit IIA n=1 Tax=Salinivibrio siamensis TaxID=414286 RepID=A0ABX3K9R6_9GAMM|nr:MULTISPECIES: DUF3389 family protein [Salinivibrio]KKA43786.1 hypothetical protein WN56_15820 [Salinivibrio sp. KP-1]OOE78481.1 hypothetical protein BZG25_12525 [Salinivibrio sp. ML198]OOE79320.1 hypothetical protein BZG72_14085 [Salinivibrio sp. PR6]OOE85622.1 hypothetical protein BZG73_08340 [Salinivibrio siamensis]
MVVDIEHGKLIVTAHEVVIQLPAMKLSMQVQSDSLQIIADANVLVADAGDVRWSLPLSAQHIALISDMTGIQPQ